MIQQTAKILQKYLKLNLSPLNSKENTFLFCASCLIIIIIITIIDIIIIMTKILKGNIGLPSISIIIVINNYNFINNNINNNNKKNNKIIEMTSLIKKTCTSECHSWTTKNELLSQLWLHISVGRALPMSHRSLGSNPVEVRIVDMTVMIIHNVIGRSYLKLQKKLSQEKY